MTCDISDVTYTKRENLFLTTMKDEMRKKTTSLERDTYRYISISMKLGLIKNTIDRLAFLVELNNVSSIDNCNLQIFSDTTYSSIVLTSILHSTVSTDRCVLPIKDTKMTIYTSIRRLCYFN